MFPMELRHLRGVALLAELGSITAVAKVLHLSAPAVHKQFRELEAELGIKVYERTGRTIRVTDAANVLLPFAREMLAQYEGAVAAVKEWKGLKKGLVRIGAGPTTSSYILPGLLRKFRRMYPNIELYMETGNTRFLSERIASGALDIALLVAPSVEEEPHLSVEVIWEVEFVLISKTRWSSRPLALEDLRKQKFILYQKGSRIENLISQYFTEARFQPQVIMRFDNAEAIKAMIRAGFGISMLPMWVVDEEIKRGLLSVIRQRERPLVSHLELVSRKTNVLSSAVHAFIDTARHYACRSPRLIYTPSAVTLRSH